MTDGSCRVSNSTLAAKTTDEVLNSCEDDDLVLPPPPAKLDSPVSFNEGVPAFGMPSLPEPTERPPPPPVSQEEPIYEAIQPLLSKVTFQKEMQYPFWILFPV